MRRRLRLWLLLALLLATTTPPARGAAPRTLDFAGYTWNVKSGCGLGPGPNCWDDNPESVWVDAEGLHLRLRQVADVWYSAEVYTVACVPPGSYRFHLVGALDALDPQVVAAVFLYQDDAHELDIEFSRWGDPQAAHDAQYVVQPGDLPQHRERFTLGLTGTYSTHRLTWRPGRAAFHSWHGHYAAPPHPDALIQQWTYAGDAVPDPRTSCMRVHINLWLYQGQPPSNGQAVEIVVRDVVYTPLPTVYLPLVMR